MINRICWSHPCINIISLKSPDPQVPSSLSFISVHFLFWGFQYQKKSTQYQLDKVTWNDIRGLWMCYLWSCANTIHRGDMIKVELYLLFSVIYPYNVTSCYFICIGLFLYNLCHICYNAILVFQQGCCFITTHKPSAPKWDRLHVTKNENMFQLNFEREAFPFS